MSLNSSFNGQDKPPAPNKSHYGAGKRPIPQDQHKGFKPKKVEDIICSRDHHRQVQKQQSRDLTDIIATVKLEQQKLLSNHKRELMKLNYFKNIGSNNSPASSQNLNASKHLNTSNEPSHRLLKHSNEQSFNSSMTINQTDLDNHGKLSKRNVIKLKGEQYRTMVENDRTNGSSKRVDPYNVLNSTDITQSDEKMPPYSTLSHTNAKDNDLYQSK